MDSPRLFVRRTLWGGLALGCAACLALLLAGLPAWAAGLAVGGGVALGNFWLLARAVLGLAGPGAPAPVGPEAGDGGAAPQGRAGGRQLPGLRSAWAGAALRLLAAAAVLGLALAFLPVHPLGVAAGLIGVHAGMAAVWVAGSLAGITSS